MGEFFSTSFITGVEGLFCTGETMLELLLQFNQRYSISLYFLEG